MKKKIEVSENVCYNITTEREETEMKNLTPYNECNEREIESMVGKAMCAYANHESAMKAEDQLRRDYGDKVFERTTAAQWSEYEATVRCIEFFVRDSIYEIQDYIIERAEAELLDA